VRLAASAALTTGLVVLLSAFARPSASAEPLQSRVIDRTFSCSVAARAAVRSVEVGARTGTRLLEDRSQWKFLASAVVRDSQTTFAYVSAGNPAAELAPGIPARPERLGFDATRVCTTTRPIPFTRSGLAGDGASPLEDRYDCAPGRRVIVRVRAVFRSPATLRPRSYAGGVRQLAAVGTVTSAEVAVRTAAGKPLAYVDVAASGRARIFVAPGCVSD